MTPVIALYTDYVFNNAAVHKRAQDIGRVHVISAQDIANNYLETENPGILIMPGGADLYYCDKLNGENNTRIRNYVEKGGGYFGICAGAYYGCHSLKWFEGTDLEISGTRELALAPACATGPIKDFINGDPIKTWNIPRIVQISTPKTGAINVLYQAGPLFDINTSEQAHINKLVDVLATYPELNDSPSIIAGHVGKGRYVLSSAHIEYLADDLESKSAQINEGDFFLPNADIERVRQSERDLMELHNEIWRFLTGL